MNICDSHCMLYREWRGWFLNNVIKDSTQDSGQELAWYLHLVCDVAPDWGDYYGPTLTSQWQQAQHLYSLIRAAFCVGDTWGNRLHSRYFQELLVDWYSLPFRICPAILREQLCLPHTSCVSRERGQPISWNVSQFHGFSIRSCVTWAITLLGKEIYQWPIRSFEISSLLKVINSW